MSIFEESFPQIMYSVIDIHKAKRLQEKRISKLDKKRKRFQTQLNSLDSLLDGLNLRLDARKISEEEFEAKITKIRREYNKLQKYYVNACFLLSRVIYKPEAFNTKAAQKIEKINNMFLKIKKEIEELQSKESEGNITSRDIKNKIKLQKKLINLIEKLDKFQEKNN